MIEPYYLVFKWSSWYVWGCKVFGGDLSCIDRSGAERCSDREDYRLFKLNRMDRVFETEKEFICRNVPMPDLSNEKIFPGGIKVKALFTSDMK